MASRVLDPSWFRWSDGRQLSPEDRWRFKLLMCKTSLRRKGETTKQRFFRMRKLIEAHMGEAHRQLKEEAQVVQ